jgi:hypothetical protein
MKRLTLGLTLAILVLSGCMSVTPYQAEGTRGGYTDLPLSEGRYQISARGNDNTDKERVYHIALVRAAELTLQNGKSHFIVLDSQEEEKRHVNYAGRHMMNVTNHHASLVIEITDDAGAEGAIDAHAQIREIGPLVGYKGEFK